MDEGANVIPIITHTIATTDTYLGNSVDWLEADSGDYREGNYCYIVEAEPLGTSKVHWM